MYNWAVNKIKLNVAIDALRRAAVSNPDIIINEETIKAEYVKRGGLLREEAEEKVRENDNGGARDLEDLTVPELRELADKQGLDHKPYKLKGDLIEALKAHIEKGAQTVEVSSYNVLKDWGDHKEGDVVSVEDLASLSAEEVADLINDGTLEPVTAE